MHCADFLAYFGRVKISYQLILQEDAFHLSFSHILLLFLVCASNFISTCLAYGRSEESKSWPFSGVQEPFEADFFFSFSSVLNKEKRSG